MRIHHILMGFILISVISCQPPQPEEKEVSFDSTKDLTDHTEVAKPDTTVDSLKMAVQPEGPDSNFVKRKRDTGIDFFGSGNEPFWSVDLDFEREFSFKTMDDGLFRLEAVEKMKGGNPDLSRYHATSDSGEIIINILQKECINDMSGYKSPYEVTIRLKRAKDKDFKEYRGCGQYTKAS